MTMTFQIFHGPGVVHFAEGDFAVASGQPNRETFDDETSAVARVLELDRSFFPKWDREATYMAGDRVRLGRSIYRALQETDARSFERELEQALARQGIHSEVEETDPSSQKSVWTLVYTPSDFLEEEPLAASTVDDQPRKRARNANGTYKANDPNTSENEAWE
jgi:hypothetical protein